MLFPGDRRRKVAVRRRHRAPARMAGAGGRTNGQKQSSSPAARIPPSPLSQDISSGGIFDRGEEAPGGCGYLATAGPPRAPHKSWKPGPAAVGERCPVGVATSIVPIAFATQETSGGGLGRRNLPGIGSAFDIVSLFLCFYHKARCSRTCSPWTPFLPTPPHHNSRNPQRSLVQN